MKIAIINTHDNGGAGKAAYRLKQGLDLIGETCDMFVKHKFIEQSKVIKLESTEINNYIFERINEKYFWNNIRPGNTITSLMYPSIGNDFIRAFENYDVINLHWISTFLSLEAISNISKTGKPLVWTLHDQNPMTGACHYAHGCKKYKSDCSNCPQLVDNEYNITKQILDTKALHIPKNMAIVTPSLWLAECARESTVFKNHRIEVISNSVELEIFKPIAKNEAKAQLGFSEDTKLILFGAQDLNEKRKGFEELLKAIAVLKDNEYIKSLLVNGQLQILSFGMKSEILDSMKIPYNALGYINDDEQLATIYSASDVLTLPSLEDNQPNLILESLSCGTPVVGFRVGGIGDEIQNGLNGYTSNIGDIHLFAENIVKALKDSSMNARCIEYARDKYKLERQAGEYKELYQDMIDMRAETLGFYGFDPSMYPEIAASLSTYLCDASLDAQKEINELKSKLVSSNEQIIEKTEQIIEKTEQNKQNLQGFNEIQNKLDQITTLKEKLIYEKEGLLSVQDILIEEREQLIKSRTENMEKLHFQENEIEKLINEITRISANSNHFEQMAYELKLEVTRLQNSNSWRLTLPLRLITRALKKTVKFILPYAAVKYYQKKKYKE